jgi:hypothetical protein
VPHPTTQQLRAMIKQAMQDRAPKMYRRLRAGGLLEQEVDDRAELWHEAHELAIGRVGSPYQKALGMDGGLDEKVAALTMAAAAAREQAFAVALEFPNEEDEAEPPA